MNPDVESLVRYLDFHSAANPSFSVVYGYDNTHIITLYALQNMPEDIGRVQIAQVGLNETNYGWAPFMEILHSTASFNPDTGIR